MAAKPAPSDAVKQINFLAAALSAPGSSRPPPVWRTKPAMDWYP